MSGCLILAKMCDVRVGRDCEMGFGWGLFWGLYVVACRWS